MGSGVPCKDTESSELPFCYRRVLLDSSPVRVSARDKLRLYSRNGDETLTYVLC